MKKKPCLLSIISYHITLQRSCLGTFPLKSSFSHIHCSVCIDTKRIVSDGCRAQMAVSHDGVESLQHVAGGGFPSSVGGDFSPQRTRPTDSKPCSCGPSVNRNGAENGTNSCCLEVFIQQMNTESSDGLHSGRGQTTAHICGTNGH